MMNSKIDSLCEYYVNRYQELHEKVLQSRLQQLDENIAVCQQVYDEIASKEDQLEEIVQRNQNIEARLNEIHQEIEAEKSKVEEKNQDFMKQAQRVTDHENQLVKSNFDYYQNILTKLATGNIEETIEYIDFVMDVLKYTMYEETLTYLAEATEALQTLDQLNELEYTVKKRILDLENEKKVITASIETISFEETEEKLDHIAFEISSKKTAKIELSELFANLKVENKKHILDEIKHLDILEYTNQQIAMKMDEMLESFKKTLVKIDTHTNITSNKKIELAKLKEESEQLKSDKETYDQVLEEYNQLQSMYQTIASDIIDIENYVTEAKKAIESSANFKEIVKRYSTFLTKHKAITTNYEALQERLKDLISVRKSKINDPYGKVALEQVNQEIKKIQTNIENMETEVQTLQQENPLQKATEVEASVIRVFEDSLACESQLPILYDKQQEFHTLINEKYDVVNQFKAAAIRYGEILSRIEELQNEIEHI